MESENPPRCHLDFLKQAKSNEKPRELIIPLIQKNRWHQPDQAAQNEGKPGHESRLHLWTHWLSKSSLQTGAEPERNPGRPLHPRSCRTRF